MKILIRRKAIFLFLKMIFYIFLLIFFILMWTGLARTIWLPTKRENFEKITKLIKLKEGMNFCDPGSGTGSLLFYLSKNYNLKCQGIEISPLFYLYSKIKSFFFKNVKIKYGKLFRSNLRNCDIIYAFLFPEDLKKLEKKLLKEAKEGAFVITHFLAIKRK